MSNSLIIPCLRYRDAAAAIEWLCSAFGFEKQAAYPNPDGSIAHAQLTLDGGMVMLGSVGRVPTEWGKLIRQPDELGPVNAINANANGVKTAPIKARDEAQTGRLG
ncbi:VOC family protein [Polaromonas sp. CT11-55]|uniref:VOC family protein n=1 Tax=Polaromonas sp. CT11-55 TaxID=3243045 RepID=UPI0039A558E0